MRAHSTIASPPSASRLAARLRFRHLQMLVALRRHGSLRAAAEGLNLTQPALSKALGEIEAVLGLALFTRNARGLTPTAAGETVIRSADWMLAELDHMQREAHAGQAATAIVRVGAPPFVAQVFLPEVFRGLSRQSPPVHVQLLEDRVPTLVQALDAGELDALVTSYPAPTQRPTSSSLRYENLFEAEYAIIAPAGHVLTRARQVDWARLSREPWVLPAWSSMSRRVLEEAFMHAGVAPPLPVVESTSPVTNVQLVAAGLGLAMVPAAILRHAVGLQQVKRVRVVPMIAPGPVALVYHALNRNPRVDLLREALGLATPGATPARPVNGGALDRPR